MQKKIYLLLSFIVCFLIYAGDACSEERHRFFDLGIGAGLNLDGNGTQQALLIPALNVKFSGKPLWFRFEGNFELINSRGKLTGVFGISPFLRYYFRDHGIMPFMEAGAGANVITSNHTGKKNSGGAFVFSPSAGTGIQFGDAPHSPAVSVRFRHLSNGHIYEINESLNTLYLLFSVVL